MYADSVRITKQQQFRIKQRGPGVGFEFWAAPLLYGRQCVQSRTQYVPHLLWRPVCQEEKSTFWSWGPIWSCWYNFPSVITFIVVIMHCITEFVGRGSRHAHSRDSWVSAVLFFIASGQLSLKLSLPISSELKSSGSKRGNLRSVGHAANSLQSRWFSISEDSMTKAHWIGKMYLLKLHPPAVV